MNSRILFIGLIIVLLFCNIACKKSEVSNTPEKESVIVAEEKLDGTFWLYVSQPSMYTGSTEEIGFAFIDGQIAETITKDHFSRVRVRKSEYEFKNGEGVFYPSTKQNFEEGLRNAEETYKMMGIKRTQQELIQEMENIGSVLKFKISGEKLILAESAINRGVERECMQKTLEEMQEVFKGYRNN